MIAALTPPGAVPPDTAGRPARSRPGAVVVPYPRSARGSAPTTPGFRRPTSRSTNGERVVLEKIPPRAF